MLHIVECNGKTLIFHLLIIRSVSGVLHSGMKWSCFIFAKANASSEKAFYEARLCRMKHILCLRALLVKHQNIWSTAWQRYEAKPFQASCFFCLDQGKKNGRGEDFWYNDFSVPQSSLNNLIMVGFVPNCESISILPCSYRPANGRRHPVLPCRWPHIDAGLSNPNTIFIKFVTRKYFTPCFFYTVCYIIF